MEIDLKRILKSFSIQSTQSSCGLACLISVANFYGQKVSEEQLKVYAGTTTVGTSLLGLKEAAKVIGFDAEGYEADIISLKELKSISILHTININSFTHFIVLYGYNHNKKCFIIGDPAEGVIEYQDKELEKIWGSKLLLTITPTDDLYTKKTVRKRNKFSFLKDIISPDIHLLIITFILSLATSSLNFAGAVFSQKLIDDILPSRDIKIMISFIGLYFVVLLIGYFLSYLKSIFIVRQTKLFNTRLISKFLSKMFSFPISFFNSMRTGELIARMKETERIQGFIVTLIDSTLVELLTLVMSILFLIYYNIVIASVAALSIPFLIIISKHFSKIIRKEQQELLNGYADYETYSVESISGMKFIKSFAQESFFMNRLKTKYSNTMKAGQLLGITSIKYNLIISVLGSLFSVVAISLGAYYVMIHQLEIGEFFAILTILTLTISSTLSIVSVVVNVQESLVSLDRLQDIVEVSPEEETSIPKRVLDLKYEKHKLEIKNITFNYPGQLNILDNINIIALTGQIVTLFGDVGEGKSTLLNLIQRFYVPKNGVIKYDGIDINEYSISHWRNNLGLVSQSTKIFMGSVADNISLFKSTELENIKKMCRDKGLLCFLENGPLNLMNTLNEDGANLSGGQIQLVGFARALYSDSNILILDEPTSSMDKQNEILLMDILLRIKNEKMIIMITHKPEIARKSDKIYVLHNGKIQGAGCHSDLLKFDNSYSKSFNYLIE